ncbi:MAG TPA: hypothetical protein VFU05_19710, partial [Cyclobacteriaceae bacterium]|nr:hypothetical protein [Cyclobacteriaceae bacterium]
MKRILLALLAVVVIVLMYYLFVRSFEYEVNFRATTTPGDVIETIRLWNRSIPGSQITEVDSFSRLNQTIVWKGRNYSFNWNFDFVN